MTALHAQSAAPQTWQHALPALLRFLQTSHAGSPEFDARIDCALNEHCFGGMASACGYWWLADIADSALTCAEPTACWSEDLTASLKLVPDGFNFSMGLRDGVCWTWLQPNDDWMPGENQARHDHPKGSGLVVAYTMALAMISAALIMRSLACRQQAMPC